MKHAEAFWNWPRVESPKTVPAGGLTTSGLLMGAHLGTAIGGVIGGVAGAIAGRVKGEPTTKPQSI